ncbi:Basic-leucine zipper transcription factor [Trema orientale]|uniref:Basic-leucine zipper transcription factor n=1 Tax=Trema orientale TaxID=63057 RepID=A0A2P5FP84_TREOI|nr:Basic-leucine zipper transcription factor [Trema orientale]
MAGSSTTTGGSSHKYSGYSDDQEEQQQKLQVVDRKRKRMLSNRESARRSRMRKQKHLDDLVSQVGHLKEDNSRIMTSINITNQLYVNMEAENSVLRAQMAELTNRLQSLNEIIDCINSNGDTNTSNTTCPFDDQIFDYDSRMMIDVPDDYGVMMMMNPWNSLPLNQPIMASADQMYMY